MKRNTINMSRKYKVLLIVAFCFGLIEQSPVHGMITCEEAKKDCKGRAAHTSNPEEMCSAFSQLFQVRLNLLRGGNPTSAQLMKAREDANNLQTLRKCANIMSGVWCEKDPNGCRKSKIDACDEAGTQCPIDLNQLKK